MFQDVVVAVAELRQPWPFSPDLGELTCSCLAEAFVAWDA